MKCLIRAITALMLLLPFSLTAQTTFEDWYKVNQANLVKYNRQDFIQNVPFPFQSSALAMMDAKFRFNIWKEKTDQLRRKKWTAKEKVLIDALAGYLKPEIFSEKSGKANGEFTEKWEKYALDELKWTEEQIVIIMESLYLPDERAIMDGNIEQARQIPGGVTWLDPPCRCRWSLYCYLTGEGGCEYGGCEEGVRGYRCGVFSTSPCKGRCK